MLKVQPKPYQKVLLMEELLRSGHHFTIDELASKMGLDSRSVFRYMERVSATGRTIKAAIRSGRVKEYWIPIETQEAPDELIAALLRMDQSMTEGGIRKYHKLLMQAVDKLDPKQSKATPARTEVEPYFHLDHGPLAEHNEIGSLTGQTMDRLMSAIQNSNPVRIQYQNSERSGKKVQNFTFEPYFLSLRVGKLYLIGIQPDLNKRQLVSIVYKRIKMVTIESKRTFERDARANLSDFYKHCFGQWVPRTDAKKLDIVLQVEQPWLLDLFHESNFNPQASIDTTGQVATIKLSLYDTPDLESWLFSLHPHAKVTQPRALKERLRARAELALKMLA